MGMTFTDLRPTDINQRGTRHGTDERPITKTFRTQVILFTSMSLNLLPTGADSFRKLDILFTSIGILVSIIGSAGSAAAGCKDAIHKTEEFWLENRG